ncbi:MAG: bifunctional phosphopantothenoylcysteine decarboxylase/phosphopantothenate--cysteine ligase CoaBC [Gammaproteobacteria bacterium]|nr:bifunctional phosphopantothenoylcysteine decarboxylase/phosphopantothenate--cysteine ligase CoaBC [Pseudomonadales bacterium]MCP5347625.1 bifunctional phosphopantothenoylcysteine decarboxylase/phosphopantothenate--cysteine ligase CoaBC [Pseudomonadales bacterium]
MQSLSNKRILLGITGGIAAYKCAELTRLLIKAGASVQVAMTRAATEFITPLTMQALSGHRVHLDLLDPEAEAAMGHIELARWADLVLVAPASADFLARMAQGRADDLLSTLILASSAPIAVAPAMNQAMWADPATGSNLATLEERGVHIFGPASGDQACGDIGPGRLLEPQQLVEACAGLFTAGLLSGRKLLITAGPTREAIDPVRFISNHSSGKMGYALAAEAAAAGAQVTLVSGPTCLATPERVTRIDVESATEMLEVCLAKAGEADIFIGVAAVSDYRPAEVSDEKIKKSAATLDLRLVRNPDIISEIAAGRQRPFMVGFAAETSSLIENGRAKLVSKNLDLLFANQATDTFNRDSVAATAIFTEGEREMGPGNKHHVARQMLKLIAERAPQGQEPDRTLV